MILCALSSPASCWERETTAYYIEQAIHNLKRSGSMRLLATTFRECEQNTDIVVGDWRMLNFELPPFQWKPRARVLVEGCTESGGGYEDKTLGLWRISKL